MYFTAGDHESFTRDSRSLAYISGLGPPLYKPSLQVVVVVALLRQVLELEMQEQIFLVRE